MGAPVLPAEQPVKALSDGIHAKTRATNPSDPSITHKPALPSQPPTPTCKQKHNPSTTPAASSPPPPQPRTHSSAPKPAPSIPTPKQITDPTQPTRKTPSPLPKQSPFTPNKPKPPKTLPTPAPKQPIPARETPTSAAVQQIAKAVPITQHSVKNPPASSRPSQIPASANAVSSVPKPSTQPVVRSTPGGTRPVQKTHQTLSQSPASVAPQQPKPSPAAINTASPPAKQPQVPSMVARPVPVKTAAAVSPARTNVQARSLPTATAPVRAPMKTTRTAPVTSAGVPQVPPVRKVQQQVVKSVAAPRSIVHSAVKISAQSAPKQLGLTATARSVAAGAQPSVRVAAQPVRTTGHTVVRTGRQPVARTGTKPLVRASVQPVARTSVQSVARTSTQPVARSGVQPAARTSTQPVPRTSTQPVARTSVQPVARTVVRQVAKPGMATLGQSSCQPVARSVVQNPAKPASQPLARVASAKPGITTTVTASGVHKAVPGAQTMVRRVAPQTLPAKPATSVVRQTVARTTQPTANGPQVIARQTAVTVSRPTGQAASRTTVAQTLKTGTQPVARAVPQATGSAGMSRPVPGAVRGGPRTLPQKTVRTPVTQAIARPGTVTARVTAHTATRTVTQPLARAIPHTPGKVIVKPSGTVVSKPPSKLTPAKVANVARQHLVKTQPAPARTAVHPGVLKAVQKSALVAQVPVRTAVAGKPSVQARSAITTPVKPIAGTARSAVTSATRPPVQTARITTPVKQAGVPVARVPAARVPVARAASVVRQVSTQPQGSVMKSAVQPAAVGVRGGQTTPVKKPVTATPAQTVTPQKRPPLVPPEALAAAMAAAAAVEPTPPLQPRAHPSLATIKPTTAATRIAAKTPQLGLATPTKATRSAPVCLPKPATAAPSASTATARKAGPAPSSTPTPTTTPVKEPSRIPEGMTFLPGEHVTIWNHVEKRKIAGNAAPLGKNVEKYLRAHPDCEVYVDQDEDRPGSRSSRKRPKYNYHMEQPSAGDHVAIWNRVERRKIAGNAAPLAKNLESYLKKNTNCEVYKYQDTNGKPNYRGRGREKTEHGTPRQEPTEYEFVNTPLDAWKDLNSYIDSEVHYKTDYEQTAELLLTHGDDDDDVSPLIMTGPLGVEEPYVMIDLDKFINNDDDDICEPLGDLLDDTLPPLKGSLEVPNST